MFKYILLFCCILLVPQKEPTITWSSHYELEWSDFRGEPRINGNAVAVTASGLTFGYSTKRYSNGDLEYDFNIKAEFYPERSYYLRDRVTAVTLAHERLHFDIAELHARKFRKAAAETRFTQNIDQEVNRLYENMNRALRQMQQLYDKETNHSINIEAQKEWEEKVERWLKDWEAY